MRSSAKSTLWSTLLFALLGLAWCGYMAFPTASPPPCATSGCALFRDTRFAGLSLWAVGGAYFFVLAVLCLRGSRRPARLLALAALILDALLLLIMFLFAPCFNCLVAAACTGLCYYSLQGGGDGWFQAESGPSLLLPLWLGLFLGNSVLAGNEMLPMHSIGVHEKAEVRIFFSPSCPACREALVAFGDKATLFPVLESEGDLEAIMRLEAFLAAKTPMREALSRSMNPDEPLPKRGLMSGLLLEIQLLRNKAALMRQGFRALPLIQINGMPGQKATSLEKPGGAARNGQREPGAANGSPAPAPQESDNGAGPAGEAIPPGENRPDLSGEHRGDEGRNAAGAEARQGEALPDFLDADVLKKCGGDAPQPCE